MASPIRRLPEAIVVAVFSALELREHCAFRHCGRVFDVVARRPSASPHLLRLLAVPPPPPPPPPPGTTTSKNQERKKTRPAATVEERQRRRPPTHRPTELAQLEAKLEADKRAP
jgi:hypothetical protein